MKDPATKALDLDALKKKARDLRLDILDMTTKAASGHPSSSFSAVEILTALYFGGILRYRSDDPHWPDRDRFLLSKGHAAPLLYATLAHAGYFDRDLLWTLRQVDSLLEGHPVEDKLPGIETTSGSLGKGISVGIGHVLAGRHNKRNYRVYVLLGDGECEEGQIWEAAIAAAHFKADNLIAIVDYNKFQETGPISREMALEPFLEKWRAFGWHAEEVDGHDIAAIIEMFNHIQSIEGKPKVILAHTVKGKGVSFVEADYTFHGRALKPEQAEKAREEILCE
ncbi:MAG: transketolase [Anaerolineales bacterium]|nr:transketolase [Anaerolineales bacterium]